MIIDYVTGKPVTTCLSSCGIAAIGSATLLGGGGLTASRMTTPLSLFDIVEFLPIGVPAALVGRFMTAPFRFIRIG